MLAIDLPGFRPSGWTWVTLALLTVVSVAVGRRAADRLDVHPVGMTAWLCFVGGYVAATVPPQSGPSRGPNIECRFLSDPLSPGIDLADAHQLLNVLIMVPIGVLSVAVVDRRRTQGAGLIVGALLPLGAEAAQALLPASRTCDAIDVVDGWIGLTAGAALGAFVLLIDRWWRHGPDRGVAGHQARRRN
ncbi:MAG: VanZ family protein [Acidimicrobiales bacterium]|nr:VanZ family protein [Acidimicrobiales bacterium]